MKSIKEEQKKHTKWDMPISDIKSIFFLCGLALVFTITNCSDQTSLDETVKPRVVITTDPELDDLNTLIRFLLHSADVQVEGLVYASSQYHWKGDGEGTLHFVEGREYTRFGLDMGPMESWRWGDDERFIHDAVEAYAEVYPNLKVHDSDYPTPEYLMSKIKVGNVEFDGVFEKDTPGSDLIKSLILDDNPGPLYLTAHGGQSTIARALKSIQDEFEGTDEWNSIQEKVQNKVVLVSFGDQDDTGENYIQPNWPGVYPPGQTVRGGGGYGYLAQTDAAAEDSVYYTSEWLEEHVRSKGPLGELYRVWGDGKQMVEGDIFDHFGYSEYTTEELREMGYVAWAPVQEQGSWISEGDTPVVLNFFDFGLRAREDLSYGGVGGFQQIVTDEDGNPVQGEIGGGFGQGGETYGPSYPNFFPVVQHDFGTRMHWSVTPEYEKANHPPEVSIDGSLNVSAQPGEEIQLIGSVSDPDGDSVSSNWWQFQIVDEYEGEVEIRNPNSTSATVVVPEDAESGDTIHVVLEGTDNPQRPPQLPLTRYQRVIITVE